MVNARLCIINVFTVFPISSLYSGKAQRIGVIAITADVSMMGGWRILALAVACG